MKHQGINRLLCAATVNSRFCDVLLHDPVQALSMGYLDHTFALTPEETKAVTSIRAQRLEDLAAQLYDWISNNGNGHKSNGHSNGHRHLDELLDLPRIC
jgi:hypothetical protein